MLYLSLIYDHIQYTYRLCLQVSLLISWMLETGHRSPMERLNEMLHKSLDLRAKTLRS